MNNNKRNKKVLIICDLFPPAFGPRMGYLVKYLAHFGWDSVVITEKINDSTYSFIADENKTIYVDFYESARFRKLRWLYVFLSNLFFNYKNRKICKVALDRIKKEPFDIILTSSYRSFPLPAALKVAKKTGLPLVADIRDIIEQYPKNEFFTSYIPPIPLFKDSFISLFKRISIKERNEVLKASDHVTTVSVWHTQILGEQNPNTSLVYNGFDPELFYPAHTPNKKFTITYTGRLHSFDMQDPDLLFRAIKQLAAEKIISPESCRLEWYVDDSSAQLLRTKSLTYGLDAYMDFKGYVEAHKIPGILNSSSILLLLTNTAKKGGPRGIMGTKAFEYLAVQKPVLCIRTDEDGMESMIRETNAGIASKDEKEVYDFIKYQYEVWLKDGLTKAATKEEQLSLYSRKEQALQFIRIFEQVLKKHNG